MQGRYDGSQNFASNRRFGFLPALLLGWRISDEPWFKSTTTRFVNSLKFRASHGLLGNDRNGPNGYGGWGGNAPTQNLVDTYEMMDGQPITNPGSGYNPQNPYANRDPRLAATVLYNGAPYRGRAVETFRPGGLDSPDGPESFNTSPTGYYLRKFINEARDLGASSSSQAPWIYFRLGEVLLNYAEAQNEAAGPDASVYRAINQVRARVSMPALPTVLTQAQMRERIRRERQVELAYEEHRYYDVRRWKIANTTENVLFGELVLRKMLPESCHTRIPPCRNAGSTTVTISYPFR